MRQNGAAHEANERQGERLGRVRVSSFRERWRRVLERRGPEVDRDGNVAERAGRKDLSALLDIATK